MQLKFKGSQISKLSKVSLQRSEEVTAGWLLSKKDELQGGAMEEEKKWEILGQARRLTREALAAEQHERGMWRGELTSSALSTATAVLALRAVGEIKHEKKILAGLAWLARTQWPSGGWGDTAQSLPNLSTTLLCWAAFQDETGEFAPTVDRCERWITLETDGLEPLQLVEAMRRRYGKDQTFSVPILMACAISGRLGPTPACWEWVPQLPFELAVLPRRWFAVLSLPVVSYALPALIAIGQVRHFHAPRGLGRYVRSACRGRTLRLLREIQPEGGGYLEAVPLTSFVTMALASQGNGDHEVVRQAVGFLERSCRADGSWPIDSDLAVWGTTLTVKALGVATPRSSEVVSWLLDQQSLTVHPYTLSAAGGWAWTDLPGGVPDADDTAGVLLALAEIGLEVPAAARAARRGVNWLLDLQNRDGGMPTFCRGWGTLPFDRSTPELTAHALAAWARWPVGGARVASARARSLAYLEKSQALEGWWEPLWFGNQWAPDESNPVYGTASVLTHLCSCPQAAPAMLQKAAAWLMKMQRAEGGWGGGKYGPESIEETALAVTALARYGRVAESGPAARHALRGAHRLLELTQQATHFPASPIGLYFARLWYAERLYPMIFSAAAWREVMMLKGKS